MNFFFAKENDDLSLYFLAHTPMCPMDTRTYGRSQTFGKSFPRNLWPVLVVQLLMELVYLVQLEIIINFPNHSHVWQHSFCTRGLLRILKALKSAWLWWKARISDTIEWRPTCQQFSQLEYLLITFIISYQVPPLFLKDLKQRLLVVWTYESRKWSD